jgi:hypothetical protein
MVSASGALCGQTAPLDIFQAAEAGDVPRATQILVAQPEVVRTRRADGWTPLHIAARAGKAEMVTFLGSRGAELSAGPETPLLAAVDCADGEAAFLMSQFLLGNASDPNARTSSGRTALEVARARGYREIAELLIHRGAKGAGADGRVEVAWYGRRYASDAKGNPVKRDDLNGLPWTMVNEFARLAHFDFDKVKRMLGDEPGLQNTRASWDELAVEASAHMGRVEMAEWLAERGAAVSTCTAVLLGLGERVREAVAADARSVRERGAHDIAILAYTAYAKPQTAIAETLLKAGADPHGRALNLTALHLAAGKGYMELAELLVERGADVNLAVKTRAGMVTPVEMAVKGKQEKMAEWLRSRMKAN